MTDTATEPEKTYRPLLDILTEGRTLPDGYDSWSMRTVWPDFTSSRGYRWPWPGNVAKADGPILDHRDYYERCRHCGDDCGAKDRHRFRCNACQPRIED